VLPFYVPFSLRFVLVNPFLWRILTNMLSRTAEASFDAAVVFLIFVDKRAIFFRSDEGYRIIINKVPEDPGS